MAELIDMIVAKRVSECLEPEDLVDFVDKFQRDEVETDQAAAFLMAIALNGLDEDETTEYTKALMNSGQCFSFADLGYPPVDIGMTGGIGTNGAVAAICAAAVYGARLPVVGQKSLGGYSGILDLFETVSGFRGDVSAEEFKDGVRSRGVVVAGQTAEMAPANTKINQLRARTGSMGGASLTVASLLARKAAAGVRGLVVEIACGSGGAARNLSEAHRLADDVFNVGEGMGLQITGVVTDRNAPIGEAVGDCLELKENLEILQGRGHEDLKQVALQLAGSLLVVGQLATDHAHGVKLAQEAIADGRAFEKLKEIVSNQGGDTMVLDNPDNLPRSQTQRELPSQRPGHVKAIDGQSLGRALLALGGSRKNRGDATDHRVGFLVHKKVGDRIERGEPIVTVFTSERSKVEPAIEAIEEAFLISPDPVEKSRVVLENFGRRR